MDSEHSYIFDSKKDLRLIYWSREVFGKEKPELLGCDPRRILKTLFLQDGSSKIYGIVLPLDKRLETKSLADYLDISRKKASRLRFADTLPYLHKPGSIAPFICDKDFDLVSKIIFSQEKFEDFVDFSYPGRADISLHAKYEDAIHLLSEKYPGLIMVRELKHKIDIKTEKIARLADEYIQDTLLKGGDK